MERKQVITGVGGVLAAVIASSCCWLPLLLLAVGAGATAVGAVTSTIETYRPFFAIVAVAFLGAAWYFTYFRRPVHSRGPSVDACCAIEPKVKTASASTEECCAVPPGKDVTETPCSCCHQKGKRVPASTVRALVREPLRGQVHEGDYVLCLNPGCAQVYNGPDGARPFMKSDLAVRVGYKEQEGPHLVCYCFDHSVEEIESQLRGSGKTAVPESIKAEVKAGRCACEVKNPQGTCCLGNVNRAVKEAEARIAGRPTPPIGAPSVQCAPPPSLDESHEDCCSLPRKAGAPEAAVGRLKRLNKVILPIVTLLVLGMVFFPHQMFAFLAKSEPASPEMAAPVTSDANLKTVILYVPGMS